MRLELLSSFGVPPTLQQTVHVQVGQQRTAHASHNVAKLRIELSVSVSRLTLRPCYGEGFGGAPLTTSFSFCDLQRSQKEGSYGSTPARHPGGPREL
jgi:hypothetical protein